MVFLSTLIAYYPWLAFLVFLAAAVTAVGRVNSNSVRFAGKSLNPSGNSTNE